MLPGPQIFTKNEDFSTDSLDDLIARAMPQNSLLFNHQRYEFLIDTLLDMKSDMRSTNEHRTATASSDMWHLPRRSSGLRQTHIPTGMSEMLMLKLMITSPLLWLERSRHEPNNRHPLYCRPPVKGGEWLGR
jgi:hypothetical protein